MSIGADLLLVVTAAGSGLGGAWVTNRRSNKTLQAQAKIDKGKLELDNRREDGAAYERAAEINQQIVDGLRAELTALQQTIVSLRSDLAAEKRHSAHLEHHIRDLESSARVMRDLLAQAGIEVPPLPGRRAATKNPEGSNGG